MIKHWFLTGDCHGRIAERLGNIQRNTEHLPPEETAVIILGDAGANFWLNGSDRNVKKKASRFGYTIYCLRGNHDARPADLNYSIEWDDNVDGEVYLDPEFSCFRYLIDGGEYTIANKSVLAIGGAYSVDKWYRLKRAEITGDYAGWFPNEQLNAEERAEILEKVKGNSYDVVFTHTCPYSWRPVDLFLPQVDQSTVDNTMEEWLEDVKNSITWGIYCFGHYHADRIERERVHQFYNSYILLQDLFSFWGLDKND